MPTRHAATRSDTVNSTARWRPPRRWSRRTTVATVALAPLWYAGYRTAVGTPADGSLAWTLGLVGLALLAAATLATYLPAARPDEASCSIRPARGGVAPCAATPIFSTVLAAVVLAGAVATPMAGVFALVLILMGLAQRLLLPASCGT